MPKGTRRSLRSKWRNLDSRNIRTKALGGAQAAAAGLGTAGMIITGAEIIKQWAGGGETYPMIDFDDSEESDDEGSGYGEYMIYEEGPIETPQQHSNYQTKFRNYLRAKTPFSCNPWVAISVCNQFCWIPFGDPELLGKQHVQKLTKEIPMHFADLATWTAANRHCQALS